MNKNYLERMQKQFGDIIENPGSILVSNDEGDFWSLLEEVSFSAHRLVEIGTARGISATLLSEVADEIWTFDIEDYPIKHKIWEHFDVLEKIRHYIVEGPLEFASVIGRIDFDAVFIDGNHKYEHVIVDIFLTEDCGSILFHDYHIEAIRKAIDNLVKRKGGSVTIRGKYAYWTNR